MVLKDIIVLKLQNNIDGLERHQMLSYIHYNEELMVLKGP